MADTSVPSLTALTSPATGDILYIVDISDTTDSASGSSRYITYSNLISGTLTALGITSSVAELNFVDGVTSAIQTQLNTKAPTASPTFTGTVTLPTGLTGIIRTDSGVVSVDTDVTDIVSAASTTAAGKVELAIDTELNTGTDATRAVTPDSLAGSNYGKRTVSIPLNEATALTTGDGKKYLRVPSWANGWNLVEVAASRLSGTDVPTIQIHNLTQTADMLSTRITIDTNETDSSTAATAAVIDTGNDDLATGDRLRIDVDVAGTNTLWCEVQLTFQLP